MTVLMIQSLYRAFANDFGEWQVEETNDHDDKRAIVATFHGDKAEELAKFFADARRRSPDSRFYPNGQFPKGQLRMGG